MGDALTAAQYREAEELGILVDKDDQARPAKPGCCQTRSAMSMVACGTLECSASRLARCAQPAALVQLMAACRLRRGLHVSRRNMHFTLMQTYFHPFRAHCRFWQRAALEAWG